MKFNQITHIQARWKVPFIVLLIFIITVWMGNIYLGTLHETYDGEFINKELVKKRALKASKNVCVMAEPEISDKVVCSELDKEENRQLNEKLSILREHLNSAYGGLLEAAKYFSDTFIKEGVFVPEKGGSIHVMIVISSIIFTAFCMLISVVVLFIALPIFLNSDNEDKAKKAGGLVKTCLGFIVASGTTLVGGFVITAAIF